MDVSPVQRAVLHALQLALEDLEKFCSGLSAVQLNARLMNLAPVAFHIRHIARSVDRLLTYAEGKQLTPEKLLALQTELGPGARREELFELGEARWVGKKRLPSTVGGLLVHIAEHTQRHVGQAITTAKVVRAQRG
jgi:hypothetical protein